MDFFVNFEGNWNWILIQFNHILWSTKVSGPVEEEVLVEDEDEEGEDFVNKTDFQNLLSNEISSFTARFKEAVFKCGNQDTLAALVKAGKRLDVLTNPNLLNSALHTFGTSVGRGGWGKIAVQPTSRSRRKEGTHRGRAAVQRGRKPKLVASRSGKKRAHNLSSCIRDNVANGKQHNSTMF